MNINKLCSYQTDPEEFIYLINRPKWITQVLALSNSSQRVFFPHSTNVIEELKIHWRNAYTSVRQCFSPPLTERQISLFQQLNDTLNKIDSTPNNLNYQLFELQWENVRKLANDLLTVMAWEQTIPSAEEAIYLPWMRNELIVNLQGLADEDYQYRAWVKHELPIDGYDEFDLAVHILYDDAELASDPESCIGELLKNKSEEIAITDLILQLNILFKKYGKMLSDKDYIEKPEWKNVVKAAQKALQIFNPQ